MANYNHLCKEQRNTIKYLLEKNYSFTYIAKSIHMDRTTISKEIRRNRFLKSPIFLPFNIRGINQAIKSCSNLSKPPYCCNSCKEKGSCQKMHLYYNAKVAQKHYEETLVEARKGVDISIENIEIINKNIVPLIKNRKQSVNQVYINHPDILYFSKPTFYKYVNEGIISLNNFDLSKKVKYKKRKNKKEKKIKEFLLFFKVEDMKIIF